MSTATSTSLHTMLRDRLLSGTFGTGAGTVVTTLLGAGNNARLYQNGIPDGAAYPFAEMLIVNDATTSWGDGIRTTFDLEVTIVDRPRTQISRARNIADAFDNGMVGFTFAGADAGFLRITDRSRSQMPQGTGDVDREVVQIRQLFSGFMWSQMLARTYP